jgi:hypothetical protein
MLVKRLAAEVWHLKKPQKPPSVLDAEEVKRALVQKSASRTRCENVADFRTATLGGAKRADIRRLRRTEAVLEISPLDLNFGLYPCGSGHRRILRRPVMIKPEVFNLVFRAIQDANVDFPKTVHGSDRPQIVMADADAEHLVWAVFRKLDAHGYAIVEKKS